MHAVDASICHVRSLISKIRTYDGSELDLLGTLIVGVVGFGEEQPAMSMVMGTRYLYG